MFRAQLMTSLKSKFPLKGPFGFSLFCALALGLSACGTTEIKPPIQKGPVSAIIEGDYETLWRALQVAALNYPILINDYDGGLIETDTIRSDKAWVTPGTKLPGTGYRYKLTVRALRLRQDSLEPAARVSVWKKAENQRDFFTEANPIESDGLEEAALLYRVKREIEVIELLTASQKAAK